MGGFFLKVMFKDLEMWFIDFDFFMKLNLNLICVERGVEF